MRYSHSVNLPVTFDHPWLLLIWPAIIAWFIFWTRNSRSGLDPSTIKLAIILRGLLTLLLVFMIAGIHIVSRTNRLTTIFLLDVSRSIRPDERAASLKYIEAAGNSKPANDNTGLVTFGRSATLQAPVSTDTPDLDNVNTGVDGDATNLRGALQLASASMPADTGRKIVILSDGNENIGSAADEIQTLKDSGVIVDIAPTALNMDSVTASSPEALIDDVRVPEHGRQDTPFTVGVVVSSNINQHGKLTLTRDGQVIARQTVDLPAGKRLYTFTDRVGQAGSHRYDADLQPEHDTMAENNQGYGFISIRGKPRVLYVTDTPTAMSLTSAIKAQGIDVNSTTPGDLPANVAALASYDSIVVSDVPATELTVQQMQAIEESVREFGVGFGLVGGPNSYAAGGYDKTPIEDALPVNMDIRDLTRNPPVAIVLVIEDLEEPGLVNESIEAAKATVKLLHPQDQIGILDCNDTWRVPMTTVNSHNLADIESNIDQLQDMNDPYQYDPYLQDAANVLAGTKAPIKHLILLGDGDAEAPDPTLIAGIRKQGITVSAIITGADDLGVQELSTMASEGGGHSYVVEKDSDLPHFLQRDQQAYNRIQFVEKDIYAKADPGNPIVSGIDWASAPPLRGYNISGLKPDADLPLYSPDHSDPLLATWRYGLGRTFAFTSDDQPHWAVHWLSWPGFGRLWGQTIHWSLRSTTPPDFNATVEGSDGRGKLVVDAFSTKGWENGKKISAHIVAPDLTDTTVTLTQTSPGRYEGGFDADQVGAYLVSVKDETGKSGASDTLGMVVPYSPEYRTLQSNLPLLTELADETGGKIQSDPTQVFNDAPVWVAAVTDIGPALLLIAALLFLADIAVRRLAIRPKALQAGANARLKQAQTKLSSMVPAPVTRVPTPEMAGKLMTRAAGNKEEEPIRRPHDVLNRSAAGQNDDNPFPQVASLRTQTPENVDSHSDRTRTAQRAARDRIDPD